ncbi:complex I NDUFA9 subunit family protein [Parerythrobacter jejuensis]|uniref:NAD(P)H-binding protein n=1 Tax=Parerythrobacter jejuensis TaxID=795812 RepID=A0A845AV15_9SPHN|nr:complex I NDUFA9 subunit family protein [Parerythrobacter jejuensis]MXP30654.1 NAD(P)H-binding protein [Parerythrobacter jejuensis]MXP33414.1 NAD(P)H-binding protein [Parerythrobacter jejuensis]
MARSNPLADKLVTVFGGSGFLGTHVAQALLERGARLRIASRNPEKAFTLKPLANLGQLQFARCDITNERSVAACLHGADAVINLVGSFEGDQIALMGKSAGTIAQLAKENGVQALVQVTAIGADPEGQTDYSRGKGIGEQLVLDAFPKATILRPSIVFGQDDNFLNMFAGLIQMLPVLPVFGPKAQLQLVHVDDVAAAVVASLADPAKHGGKTFELGGPEVLTMLEINQRIADAQRRQRSFIEVPDFASATFATLPLTPMSRDQWTMLKQGNIVSGDHPGFKQLGIEPKPLSLFLDKMMVQYRKQGRFTTTSATTGN